MRWNFAFILNLPDLWRKEYVKTVLCSKVHVAHSDVGKKVHVLKRPTKKILPCWKGHLFSVCFSKKVTVAQFCIVWSKLLMGNLLTNIKFFIQTQKRKLLLRIYFAIAVACKAKSFAIAILVGLMCKAKSFAVVFLFFSFFFSTTFLNWSAKAFCLRSITCCCKHVGPVPNFFVDTLANSNVYILKFCAWVHDMYSL